MQQTYRDAWGIPHLRAGSAEELAFAQGQNASHDRAWQIERERHYTEGTTASFAGPETLSWDRFARQVRLADTARRCFEGLQPETQAWVTAYVEGVNAGLWRGAEQAPEFGRLGVRPGTWQPWTPLGIWLTAHVLFSGGAPSKLWREHVAQKLGPEAVSLFNLEGPGGSGSNGWLVDGTRTVTGSPIVAGDPHRFIEDPGVYQQVHLSCPEFDVVGMAVPGVPGIAHFGHTGGVAWAITNAMADYQDLYAERLRRSGDAVEALGPDGWRPATRHVETIEVAGAAPVQVEVIETERGPVIVGGPDDDRAISFRHPPRASAELGFDALPELLRAATVGDVDRAFDRWIEPVNVVLAADTRGGSLHRTAGRVPVRDDQNRVRVVPAWEGRHAWQDWHLSPEAKVDGIAVMANERGLAEPLGIDFAPPHRARRIRALLDRTEPWSAKEMPSVHMDTHAGKAQVLLGLLAGLDGLGPKATALRERLLGWDRRMDAESNEAASYAALRAAVVRRLAATPELRAATEPAGYPELFAPWMDLVPWIGFALESLLTMLDVTEVVRAAAEEVAGQPVVPWGERHRLVPLPGLGTAPFEPGPALSGDGDCVLAASSLPGVTDRCARGPVARYVWDLARREDSLWVVPLGASGRQDDPHHRDQTARWAAGELVPVITDWNQLTEETDV